MNKLKRIYLASTRAAETFVRRSNIESNGWSARWDGWDIVTFIPNPGGYNNPRGGFDRETNQWGYFYTFRVNERGSWVVKVPEAIGQGR